MKSTISCILKQPNLQIFVPFPYISTQFELKCKIDTKQAQLQQRVTYKSFPTKTSTKLEGNDAHLGIGWIEQCNHLTWPVRKNNFV